MSLPVVVDSSVWIEHFRHPDAGRADQIAKYSLRLHDFILGDLILGGLARRHPAMQKLSVFPRVPILSHEEVVELVRVHKLEGSGIGWVDAHVLASTEAADATLWTLDQSLLAAAHRVGVPCIS